MSELLLEILSEEIPARMQARAADDLKRLVGDALKQNGLTFDQVETYVTPRRLAIVVDGLPDQQPDAVEERKGPRVGAPDQALNGFLKSAGLTSIEACEIRSIKDTEFYFLVTEKKGGNTADILPSLLSNAVHAIPWPKSMRWSSGTRSYVRPVHGILCLFDGKVIPVEVGFGEGVVLQATNETVGHRFMAPDTILVSSSAEYLSKLKHACVMVDREERKSTILEQATELARAAGLSLVDDPGLLDEVTGLIEWPVVLMGSIDDTFMEVPPEVLTTAMRTHQKYFALQTADGVMAARFLLVSNMKSTDDGAAIVAGNERVLRARLSDAKFFWNQDRKQSLSSRAPALKEITFHAKIGSLDEKIDRVQALAAEIAGFVGGADRDRVRVAARLAKADLTCGMVNEFPELQGIMGRYYALSDGEHEDVANAIAEHYAPLGPSDDCPTKPVSVAVALADKIDTLVCFWAIDEKPTGSKDPYALRRAALGIIRIIIENNLRLPLTDLFRTSRKMLLISDAADADEIAQGLLNFLADRLKVYLRQKGMGHDLIASVFAQGNEDDLVRLLARVEALAAFLASEDGENLLAAYRRAANILRIEEKKDGVTYPPQPEGAVLIAPEEKAVADTLATVSATTSSALAREDFGAAMASLATLRETVDTFFDTVKVNADDTSVRENRLKLLARIRATMDQVTDFSKIEG